MISVLSKKDTFEMDEYSICSNHLAETHLMKNAGMNIAQFIIENVGNPFNQKFIVIAGPGNNGGDAIISHYYLIYYGIDSTLLLFNSKQKSSWIFDKYSIDDESIQYYTKIFTINPKCWYVDGIFGIGLKRDVKGVYKNLIDALQACPQIISIDIPSGIYCDTGLTAGTSILADLTLTMGCPKLGHYFNHGLVSSGDLYILDIGLKPLPSPKKYIEQIEHDDASHLCPDYSENIQKYNRGKLLCIAGSKGFTGAGILAMQAAFKTGAGIIKAIIPGSLNAIFETSLPEVITIPLIEYNQGSLSSQNKNEIIGEIQWADVVLFGPGLISESSNWMAQVLKKIEMPLILDASGFAPLIDKKCHISELPRKTILTPHYAEFSRIFNIDIQAVKDDPISAVEEIITSLDGRILLLKGPTNIIVNSKSKIFLMSHGTSALATAGTGDVLSGILAALVAQGSTLDDAALFGPYLHSECIQQYMQIVSTEGLTASILQEMIPYALESIKRVS